MTVVVATYGRPEVLRCALESLVLQEERRWRAIVVGDACPFSRETVATVGDARIDFVDLPCRQGEQSRPNSVGMQLAETPYVALLNHDDLWLADHLSLALERATASGADLYCSSAAFADRSEATRQGTRPVFRRRTPRRRDLRYSYWAAPFVFEPASTWMFRRELVEKVGPWSPAGELYRTPAIDWLLRALRCDVAFLNDPTITTLQLGSHHVRPADRYSEGTWSYEALLSAIDLRDPAGSRAVVDQDLRKSLARAFPRVIGAHWRTFGYQHPIDALRLRRPSSLATFLETGEDEFESIIRRHGLDRGETMRRELARRTGESLAAPASLERLVEDARRQLSEG